MPDPAPSAEGASLLQQFHALAEADGGLNDDPAVVLQSVEPETPAVAPAADKAKPAIAAAVDDGEAAKEAEKAKQGGPKPGDWAAIREEKRKFRQQAESERAALAAQKAEIEARGKALENISPEKLTELLDSGDLDEFARRIGGGKFKDWNSINDYAARRFASPEAQHNRKLAEQVEALKAERAEEKRQRDEEIAEANRARAEREFITHLDFTLKSSTDAAVKTLAEEPEFIQAVYGKIAQHYRETGEQLDALEVADEVAAGARKRYERWVKVFGDQPTAQLAEATQVATPNRAGSKKPARPTTHVARTRAAEAAPANGELSHADFIAMGKEELRKALDEDIRANRF